MQRDTVVGGILNGRLVKNLVNLLLSLPVTLLLPEP